MPVTRMCPRIFPGLLRSQCLTNLRYFTENRYSYRASIKAGTLLKDKVGSLIVTHIHGRPGMDQEQPLDLSVTKTNHKKVSDTTLSSVILYWSALV